MTDPNLPALPSRLLARGGDPSLVGAELRHHIEAAMAAHPRSQQVEIGPSEIGEPCTRKLGYKLAGVPERNPGGGDGWLPQIGTAVHTWLEGVLGGVNDTHPFERYFLEETVTVGTVDGQQIKGHCDVYDRVTATVIDWKCVGDTQLKKYRAFGPGDTYRKQAHLYGKGWEDAGLPIDTVAVYFLPRNHQLSGGYFWHEPYDRQIAVDALARLEAVAQALKGGPAVLPLLPTTESFCNYCPWLNRGSTDLATGCPGDPASAAARVDVPTSLAGALHLEDRNIA